MLRPKPTIIDCENISAKLSILGRIFSMKIMALTYAKQHEQSMNHISLKKIGLDVM